MSNLPKATAQGRKPYKRKFSNYLLNKELQLRYVVFVTLLSAIISGSLGYLIWRQENIATKTVDNDIGTATIRPFLYALHEVFVPRVDHEICADVTDNARF